MKRSAKLDSYEQDIEDHFDKQSSVKNKKNMMEMLQSGAKAQVRDKKPITIRLSLNDIEAIKIKASKLGVPYQTYINILIHKDATDL